MSGHMVPPAKFEQITTPVHVLSLQSPHFTEDSCAEISSDVPQLSPGLGTQGMWDSLHYLPMKDKSLFPCFPDGEGEGEAVSLPWESRSERHREDGETASWLEQEAPGRPGQMQAMG